MADQTVPLMGATSIFMEVLNQILAFIAICVALYGIDAWRREHVGKRHVELAEDSLALFYEASDIIKHIRPCWLFK